VSSQQRPDGRGTHPDAKLAQLPTDPHAAPPGILSRHAQHEGDDLGVDRWPARRALLRVGPLPSNQRAVPARSVCGVTSNDAHRCRGSTRLAAASRTRSRAVNLGGPLLRRSTPSCCRSTRISRSLVPSPALGRTSRRVSRRTVNQSRKSIEGWYETPAHGANPRFRTPHLGSVVRARMAGNWRGAGIMRSAELAGPAPVAGDHAGRPQWRPGGRREK
jgi:hypothetical protein